uniref:Uncharacterized protein n=1 Tax=Rhizophora mucronata TaxID=61149 RepID=A0A2P2QKI6_RHIMU
MKGSTNPLSDEQTNRNSTINQ